MLENLFLFAWAAMAFAAIAGTIASALDGLRPPKGGQDAGAGSSRGGRA
jgi:hypothetical protein